MLKKIERRKYPRYCCSIPAFIEEKRVKVWLYDLSLTGCFIEYLEGAMIQRGKTVNLVLFLPCIGRVYVKGIVQHHGTKEREGMGIEFIRFPDRMHIVYAKFVKILPILQEARSLLLEFTRREKRRAKRDKYGRRIP